MATPSVGRKVVPGFSSGVFAVMPGTGTSGTVQVRFYLAMAEPSRTTMGQGKALDMFLLNSWIPKRGTRAGFAPPQVQRTDATRFKTRSALTPTMTLEVAVSERLMGPFRSLFGI